MHESIASNQVQSADRRAINRPMICRIVRRVSALVPRLQWRIRLHVRVGQDRPKTDGVLRVCRQFWLVRVSEIASLANAHRKVGNVVAAASLRPYRCCASSDGSPGCIRRCRTARESSRSGSTRTAACASAGCPQRSPQESASQGNRALGRRMPLDGRVRGDACW